MRIGIGQSTEVSPWVWGKVQETYTRKGWTVVLYRKHGRGDTFVTLINAVARARHEPLTGFATSDAAKNYAGT